MYRYTTCRAGRSPGRDPSSMGSTASPAFRAATTKSASPRTVFAVQQELELVGRLDPDIRDGIIEMTRGGEIVGELSDEDGLPYGDATILVEFLPEGEAEYTRYVPTHVKTALDGTFRIAPVVPGARYRLALTDGSMMGGAQTLARDVVVEAGETLDLGSLSAERER